LSANDALGFGVPPSQASASESAGNEDAAGFEAAPSAGAPGDDLGFGDAPAASAGSASEPSSSEPSPWALSGSVREQSAVRTEAGVVSRLAKLRTLFDLQLSYNRDFVLLGAGASFRVVASGHGEYDLAMLEQSVYDLPTREVYTWQAYPQDLYAALTWGVLDLSFGKQIVPQGQGEVLSSLDLVNPRDLREPVVTDPIDMRLAVLMSRLGLRLGDVHLEGILVHESNPGLIAPPLGEYSPIRKLLLMSGFSDTFGGREVRYDHRPEATMFRSRSAQYHGRLSYQGQGYELALHAGSVLDALGIASLPTPEELELSELYLDLFHPRYTVVGHSGTFTSGEFVFRWEAVVDIHRLTTTRRMDTSLLRLEASRFTQLHGMLGVTWVPDTTTNASLELLQSYVFDEPTRHPQLGSPPMALLWPVEAPQLAFRASHTFFDDRVTLNLLAILIGIYPFNGFAGRADLTVKLNEAFQLNLGYVAYHASATHFGPFYSFGLNDRVLLSLRWDFAVR
jgi:hypothetical protein